MPLRITRYLQKLRIRAYRRYTPFKTNYAGFPCLAVDKSSFLYMCEEIIDRQIYKFSTTNPTPYIIDAGSNIGLATIYFKKLFPQAHILAFEPDKEISKVLKENIKFNQITDVEVIEKGLAKTAGTVQFFAEGADGGHIANPSDTENIITIQTVTLSSFLQTQKVDFLKIDIEGAELEVLEEASPYLNQVEKLFVEYHGLADQTNSLDKLLTILSTAGFAYYLESVGISSPKPFLEIKTYQGYSNQINIFAYRSK